MPSLARILIVDGDETSRAVLMGDLASHGYEVDESPDGVEAFEKLLAITFELVIAEASLGRLDTADLITKLRGHGVKTPVLVLTSITRAATLAGLMKAGIVAYLHKSSPSGLLLEKIASVLPGAGLDAAPPQAEAVIAVEAPTPNPHDPALDAALVLVIGGLAGDHQRWRAQFPRGTRLDCCATVNDALARSRNGSYRLVLFDTDVAVLNLAGTVAQIHLLLPEAPVVAVATTGKTDDRRVVVDPLISVGFDDVLLRPCHTADVLRLVEQYCGTWDGLVSVREELVQVSGLRCRAHLRDRYVSELFSRLQAVIKPLSDACFEHAIIDLTRADQLLPVETAESLAKLRQVAEVFGINLLVAVSESMDAGLRSFAESFEGNRCRWFTSAEAARASLTAPPTDAAKAFPTV